MVGIETIPPEWITGRGHGIEPERLIRQKYEREAGQSRRAVEKPVFQIVTKAIAPSCEFVHDPRPNSHNRVVRSAAFRVPETSLP
jgi:hypothetical protein